MQALRHKDPIYSLQVNFADRKTQQRMMRVARAATIARAKMLRNINVARSLEAQPLSKIEVFETASGQRYYEVMKEGGKIRLPYVSILRGAR